MIIREVLPEERDKFDSVATHPMQSWAWGEFRKTTGVDVIRLGLFDGQKLRQSYQITIHTVPKLGYKLGYFPKGGQPDEFQLAALKTAADKHNLIFVKIEPNIASPIEQAAGNLATARQYLTDHGCVLGRPMFTLNSFLLDLNQTETALLENLKGKTRYNIKVAQNNGVQVVEDNTAAGFEEYLKLWRETTKRQKFYSHTEDYHQQMWNNLSKAGIAHLLKASYQGQTLGVWILFVFNHVLYYPYGASSRKHREVMANNLLAWEAIRFGQSQNCHSFDMWGSLGANPDPKDPWFGFHRFKEGYGGQLVVFVGSYDFVVDPQKYQLYKIADKWRWRYLRLRSKLPF